MGLEDESTYTEQNGQRSMKIEDHVMARFVHVFCAPPSILLLNPMFPPFGQRPRRDYVL